MKRKYALAAALVGALMLPLFGCQKNAGEKLSEEEVQRQAYEYLASRYSAEFTITNTKHGTGETITMLSCSGTSPPQFAQSLQKNFLV